MKHVVALDIGGTNLRAAIVDENFNIINVLIRSTVNGNLMQFYEDVILIIKDLDISSFNHSLFLLVSQDASVRMVLSMLYPNINIVDIDLVNIVKEHFKPYLFSFVTMPKWLVLLKR